MESDAPRPGMWLDTLGLLLLGAAIGGIVYSISVGEVIGWFTSHLPGSLDHQQPTVLGGVNWLINQLPGAVDFLQSAALEGLDWLINHLVPLADYVRLASSLI